MLDPLRSLAELVRTLTRSRSGTSRATSKSTGSPEKSVGADGNERTAPLSGALALREKLKERIRVVGTEDRRRAREAFVETVLAAELGERITLDPAMAEIVSKVAQQLGADTATERDLGTLFDELARETR